MKFTILDRYIGREIILTSLTVMVVLLVIVMSTEVVYLLKYMAEGTITSDGLLGLLANSAMGYVITLMPLSLFLGVLLAFGRLYRDSEMTAVLSAGVSLMRCNRPVLMVVLPMGVILLALMMYANPWIERQRDDIKNQISEQSAGSQFAAGQFNQSSSGKTVFFMESSDDENSSMDSVFYSGIEDGNETLDIARSATNFEASNGDLFTVMHQGRQYIGNSGEANYRVLQYEEYGVLIPGKENTRANVSDKARSSRELWQSSDPGKLAELQWRLTVPIAAMISALIAFPLSYTSPRSGRFAKIAVAILVYLVYSNLLGVGNSWIVQGVVPFWVGTWWVHLLAGVLLFILWVKGDFFSQRMAG